MKWEKVAIKDICTGIYDGPHATPPLSNGVQGATSSIKKQVV